MRIDSKQPVELVYRVLTGPALWKEWGGGVLQILSSVSVKRMCLGRPYVDPQLRKETEF